MGGREFSTEKNGSHGRFSCNLHGPSVIQLFIEKASFEIGTAATPKFREVFED
jgi:hypothetical protein